MKFSTAILLVCLTPFSEAVFPLKQVITKITSVSSSAPALESAKADLQSTVFEKAKALLMTLPIEGNFKTFLETIPQRSSISPTLDKLRSFLSVSSILEATSATKATSPTQWTMLFSSLAPIALLEKIVSVTLGKSLSYKQQAILRAILEEYQILARVIVTSMSLPTQYAKAVWIVYAASKVLPQRSFLSLMMSTLVLARGSDMASVRGRTLTGMALSLPLLFYGVRVAITASTSLKKPTYKLSECLLTTESERQVQGKPTIQVDSQALEASLASVPLQRLIGARKDRRSTTTPVVQFWRVGTSTQFWQSIYHAVKQDEYYCLVEDETKEPLALA